MTALSPPPESLRVVYVAANAAQAHLLAGMLEEEGIRSCVSNETLQGLFPSVPVGFHTDPRVLVDERDAPRGRQIALQFDRTLRANALTDGRAWHQFTMRAILFAILCVAVFLGVERAVKQWDTAISGAAAMMAVQGLVWGAFFWIMFRKSRPRNASNDGD